MYEFSIGLGWGVAGSTCRELERMASENGCTIKQDPTFLKMSPFQLVTFQFEGGDQDGIKTAIETRWPKPTDGQKAIDANLARHLINRGADGLGE